MAKSPDSPNRPGKTRRDPAKATRAKASRPERPPADPSLDELLNPAIARGEAGPGSQTGLKPPPDNSFDRRADFAAAHKARKSTATGLKETPQTGYVTKTPVEPPAINAKLAGALGYRLPGDDDDEDFTAPSGVTATAQALDKLLREGRVEFAGDAKIWTPH